MNKRMMVCVLVAMMTSMGTSVSAGPPPEPEQVLSTLSGMACHGNLGWSVDNEAAVFARVGGDEMVTCGLHTQYMLDSQGNEMRPNTVRIVFSETQNFQKYAFCHVEKTAAYNAGAYWYALLVNYDIADTNGMNDVEAVDVYMPDYEPLAQYAEHALTVTCFMDKNTALLQIQQLIKDWEF
jgi:hypothetical protein